MPSPTPEEIIEQYRSEIAQMESLVTAILNDLLPEGRRVTSRWSGVVGLYYGENAEGVFRLNGDIEIRADLCTSMARWRTYLHELLHCHSNVPRQDLYTTNRGWEEGAIEFLQRRLRPHILVPLGVEPNAPDILEADRIWRFEPYLVALDEVRRLLNIPEEDTLYWYAELLSLPVNERYAHSFMSVRASGNIQLLAQLTRYHQELTRRIL